MSRGQRRQRPEGGRALEAEKRAFAHRDRLTTRERYLTEGTYYNDVEKDRGRAITAYENLLDLNLVCHNPAISCGAGMMLYPDMSVFQFRL